MSARRLILALVVVAVLAAGAWLGERAVERPPATDDAPPAAQTPRVSTVDGETVITLDAAEQRAADLATAPLAAAEITTESTAYATVLDPQPLFELRARLLAAQAQLAQARTGADAAQAEYRRTRALFADDRNTSAKALQQAQAAAAVAQQQVNAARTAVQGARAALRLQFGPALAGVEDARTGQRLEAILAGNAALVRVTFPPATPMPAPASVTLADPNGTPVSAQRLSPFPHSDPQIQGQPWLYLADRGLPGGMRTEARYTADTASPATGVTVPKDAVVWYGGQRWVYVSPAPERFVRRPLPVAEDTDVRVVPTGALHPGDRVVVRGAQLLLSEELRPRGAAAECEDPPECDD
ncbi:metal transporter [Nitrogeniibacter mangrovi]|uniref:Metal transporter n=1 Tax=Nitrogeniibacter mangrovi TaxID=2016596 RepID=A0A6C1B1L0_9RHOO|nr:metal transporter [Nitrogeniibacter mangrovi]QID16154.1 metal transporter [Nitrogeniibacter mangrovi]